MTFHHMLYLLLFFTVGTVQAASFDCKQAKTDDELTVCNKQHLSDLDTEMATLYAVQLKIPMMMGAKGAVKDAQADFLMHRKQCRDDASCIQKCYQTRINTIKRFIDSHMDEYCRLMGLCG